MNITESILFPEVKIFTPIVYEDYRGFFTETYNTNISDILGVAFYQDNHSKSKKNVVRGIHYQWDKPMGKLVRVVKGSGIDIVVDLRNNSETFGQHELFEISEQNFKMVWVPEGFGHAFLSLEDDTHLCYKCSASHNSVNEGAINPLDRAINITWPVPVENLILSEKDRNAQSFADYKLNPKF